MHIVITERGGEVRESKMDIERGKGAKTRIESFEHNMAELYAAAAEGSVDSLATLLKADPLVLDKVSLTSFIETPLHVAATRDHLEFTKALLQHKHGLAAELDGQKCSALHLAAANGHKHVVKVLLEAYPGACSVCDQEGRIPLHLAAIRGRVEVLQELLSKANTDCLLQKVKGDSILHLCVKYDQLEALMLLVNSLTDNELLNSRDSRGNAILHLAVTLKQKETVKFLLSVPKVREGVDALNTNNFTPLDILEQSQWDFMNFEIQDLLARAGAKKISSGLALPSPDENDTENGKPQVSKWRWFHLIRRVANFKGEWIEDNRGSLMTVATLIATITFQSAIAPPGGVWGQDTTEGDVCSQLKETEGVTCTAGNSILAYYYQFLFALFLISDSISFMGSLMVLFLLVSGFPPKNKFCLWLLTLAVCVTVAFLGLTFIIAMILVLPQNALGRLKTYIIGSAFSWVGLVAIVGILNAIILIGRIVKWLHKRNCCKRQGVRGRAEASAG